MLHIQGCWRHNFTSWHHISHRLDETQIRVSNMNTILRRHILDRREWIKGPWMLTKEQKAVEEMLARRAALHERLQQDRLRELQRALDDQPVESLDDEVTDVEEVLWLACLWSFSKPECFGIVFLHLNIHMMTCQNASDHVCITISLAMSPMVMLTFGEYCFGVLFFLRHTSRF